MSKSQKLKEVAAVFFKLGLFAFGGPAAHIAMMEDEVVTKRNWMTRDHYLDLIGATNLIPGPNSTEMTMHCGHERAGSSGLFIAGIAFIFPAVLITGFLAYLYVEFGTLPEIAPFIKGIQPAVLAIIASAILKLGKKAVKNWELGILGLLVLAASLYGINEVIALLAGGVIGVAYFYIKYQTKNNALNGFSPLLFFVLFFGRIGQNRNLKNFPDLFKSWKYSLRKWLCAFRLPGCRISNYRASYQTRTNGCYWNGAIHTRSSTFYCNVYWISIRWFLGSSCCYYWYFLTIFFICTYLESINS